MEDSETQTRRVCNAVSVWPLSDLRYDESIPDNEVLVFIDVVDELRPMARDAAIALARSRGCSLISEWSGPPDEDRVVCTIGKLMLPLEWELVDDDEPDGQDDNLWFEASCGGRDVVRGSSHTFPGRMYAGCPHGSYGYSVSLGEMGEMSEATRYFIKGFLAGAEPDPPSDDDGEVTNEDFIAWRRAVRRFRNTGNWFGRWQTCGQCGRVLLPDRAGDRCAGHISNA